MGSRSLDAGSLRKTSLAAVVVIVFLSFLGAPVVAGASEYVDMDQSILYQNDDIVVQNFSQVHVKVRLLMQSDGNLVLYKVAGSGVHTWIWASWTQGNPGARAVFQSDGNLVVYSSSWVPLWNSGTYGNPLAQLVLQGDGNMAVWDTKSKALWITNTSQTPIVNPPPGSVDWGPPLIRWADNSFQTHVTTEGDPTERNRWQWRFDGPGAEKNYEPTDVNVVKASGFDPTIDVYWYQTGFVTKATTQCMSPIAGGQLCDQARIQFPNIYNPARSHRLNNVVCHEFGHTLGSHDPDPKTNRNESSCITGGNNARLAWWETSTINGRY